MREGMINYIATLNFNKSMMIIGIEYYAHNQYVQSLDIFVQPTSSVYGSRVCVHY
jgi:hypothetical protein